MARFASVFVVLASVLTASIASPVEKRVDHSGRGTWFDVGLGACGGTNVNSDPVVALPEDLYSANNCDQWMHITNTVTGATAYGKVRDMCPGCSGGSVDMSPSLFQQLGNLDLGVLSVEWHFEQKGFTPS